MILPHTCLNGYFHKENKKLWQSCREKGILVHGWWGCKLVQPLWKTMWNFLKILRKKDVFFIIGDWNTKVGSQETP